MGQAAIAERDQVSTNHPLDCGESREPMLRRNGPFSTHFCRSQAADMGYESISIYTVDHIYGCSYIIAPWTFNLASFFNCYLTTRGSAACR